MARADQKDSWQGRRVLLTGHTGFKGSWMAMWLRWLGADVVGYSLPAPTQPSLFEAADVADLLDHRTGDVRDAEGLATVVGEGFDVVFHLAAQALVRASYQAPIDTYATNVMGTVHLLDAVRRAENRPGAVVIVTSDKCYENRRIARGYVESDPMGGHDPYSSSKGCAELATSSFARSYFREGPTAVATARAGNVIGGGDWALDRLLPDCVRAFTAGEAVRLRNPDAVRPWQHVLEPLAGYLALAEALLGEGQTKAGGWNFGPDADGIWSVGDVVTRFASHWPEAQVLRDDGRHPHEAELLLLDSSRARTELNWRPRLSTEDAIDWSARWGREFLAERRSARALCVDQLERYARAESPGDESAACRSARDARLSGSV